MVSVNTIISQYPFTIVSEDIFAEVTASSARSAVAIVPFTILAEVTELSAIALAVPVKLPVTLPSTFATRVPVVTVRSPVLPPVNVPVPTINLSALSSNPINALFESPLSITIPASFDGVPVVPVPNSMSGSAIVVVVELTVVVVPLTVKFPDNVTLPENVCPAKASDFKFRS